MNRIAKAWMAVAGLCWAATAWAGPEPRTREVESLRRFLRGGTWASLAPELRPQEDRTGTGKVVPFYVSRTFQYLAGDRFVGVIESYADPYGKAPLVRFEFKGHVEWKGPHAIAAGAQALDYVLDEAFRVTPLHPDFAAALNQVPVEGLATWQVGVPQDILGRPFPLFNVKAGEIVKDHDLVWVSGGMLFMGAKHVDGTPFDRPERRPTNLQIPLARRR